MKKYCTRCGHEFDAVGREVICPACKAQAAEETKRAAVLKAKRASWTGESVPVRISGRASTVIREYGAAHNMTFAESLDALLQASDFVESLGKAWDDITPYKSRRRDKATSTTETVQAAKQVQAIDEHLKPTAQAAKQAAKQASKATASKASKASASKATASKASASKATASKASKASKEV